MINDLIGTGISYPLQFSGGRTVASSGPEHLNQALYLLLSTQPGERVHRPTYGCDLRGLIGRPNNVALHEVLKFRITEAIKLHEKRVSVSGITTETDPDNEHVVNAYIAYTEVRTLTPGNLVFPFYLS